MRQFYSVLQTLFCRKFHLYQNLSLTVKPESCNAAAEGLKWKKCNANWSFICHSRRMTISPCQAMSYSNLAQALSIDTWFCIWRHPSCRRQQKKNAKSIILPPSILLLLNLKQFATRLQEWYPVIAGPLVPRILWTPQQYRHEIYIQTLSHSFSISYPHSH